MAEATYVASYKVTGNDIAISKARRLTFAYLTILSDSSLTFLFLSDAFLVDNSFFRTFLLITASISIKNRSGTKNEEN